MQTMRLISVYILIISCMIGTVSLESVEREPTIFGKCIDRELRTILKIIAASQNENEPPNPIETKQEVENLMRMIKVYSTEEQISSNNNRKSRRFFFWPFRPWNYEMLPTIQAALTGSIYGGIGHGGFTLGGGLGGGLQGHWKNYRKYQ